MRTYNELASLYSFNLGTALIALGDNKPDAALDALRAENDRIESFGGRAHVAIEAPNDLDPMTLAAATGSFTIGTAVVSLLDILTDADNAPALIERAITVLEIDTKPATARKGAAKKTTARKSAAKKADDAGVSVKTNDQKVAESKPEVEVESSAPSAKAESKPEVEVEGSQAATKSDPKPEVEVEASQPQVTQESTSAWGGDFDDAPNPSGYAEF